MGPIEVLLLFVLLAAAVVIGGSILLGLWARRRSGVDETYELEQDYAATIDLLAERQKELSRRLDDVESEVSRQSTSALDDSDQRLLDDPDNSYHESAAPPSRRRVR